VFAEEYGWPPDVVDRLPDSVARALLVMIEERRRLERMAIESRKGLKTPTL